MILTGELGLIFAAAFFEIYSIDVFSNGYWWAIGFMPLLLFFSWFIYKNKYHTNTKVNVFIFHPLSIIGLGLAPALSILSSIFFMAIHADDNFSLRELDKFCILLLLCIIGPNVSFSYCSKIENGFSAQVRAGCIALLFFAFLIISTQTMSHKILTNSMQSLGIADIEIREYSFDKDKYPVPSLEQRGWQVTVHEEGRPTAKGFAPYAFGPITLLCPSTIAPWSEENQRMGKSVEEWEKKWKKEWEDTQERKWKTSLLSMAWEKAVLRTWMDWTVEWEKVWETIRWNISDCITFRTDEIRKL